MNKKINVGVYTIASVLGLVAGGLIIKAKIKNKKVDEEEIDMMAADIDIFGEES